VEGVLLTVELRKKKGADVGAALDKKVEVERFT
jgi:hypothetical protein